MKKILQIALISLVLVIGTTAYGRIYIPIDQPADQKFPIAICNLDGGGSLSKDIPEIIRNDLKLSGYFAIMSPNIFKDAAKREGIDLDSIRFNYWTAIEAQALVKGEIKKEHGKYVATMRLFDPYLPDMLVGKQYTFSKKEVREVAHRFSDEIMEALTGIRGVFNTKIVYSVATKKGAKEVYIMDMDGENSKSLTKLKTISISPELSPDGGSIVFTSYIRGKPDLYKISSSGRSLSQLVGGGGSKITPSWEPNGSRIAFSSSMSGDAEIYTTPPTGRTVRRLTNNKGIDISPTWSPDGSQIIFASDRTGNAHIYKMSSNGTNQHRLTFVGYQNDMPNWSPLGDKVVFAGRDAGRFDIFIMNPDGSNIQRLTAGAGSNEHPTWSPDGRFVVFSSTREGAPAVYMMRADGSNQTRISKGNGMLPAWGPQVK